ncbi:MAG: hypothetical protein JXR32_08015 [Anaerolineaceae bacterium]|nr:hypothetical protein [Anaerolineaceae bacterium]
MADILSCDQTIKYKARKGKVNPTNANNKIGKGQLNQKRQENNDRKYAPRSPFEIKVRIAIQVE